MAINERKRAEQLRLLALHDNAPPDPDLALEGGVPASPTPVRGQQGSNSASPAVVAAVKKDKLKRNRRRAQIITNFQDDPSALDERKRRRL